jgi:hypothetical protein
MKSNGQQRYKAFNKRHQRLYLHFHCGCRQPLPDLESALRHAVEKRHKISIQGGLIPCENPLMAISSFDPIAQILKFSCGCGFLGSLEQAKEHLKKTGHKLGIFGFLNPTGKESFVGEKCSECKETPTDCLKQSVPRLSRPPTRWRSGGKRRTGRKTRGEQGKRGDVIGEPI